jgi:hypothetical protein
MEVRWFRRAAHGDTEPSVAAALDVFRPQGHEVIGG